MEASEGYYDSRRCMGQGVGAGGQRALRDPCQVQHRAVTGRGAWRLWTGQGGHLLSLSHFPLHPPALSPRWGSEGSIGTASRRRWPPESLDPRSSLQRQAAGRTGGRRHAAGAPAKGGVATLVFHGPPGCCVENKRLGPRNGWILVISKGRAKST